MLSTHQGHKLEVDDLEEAWRAFKVEGDMSVRNRLMLHYISLVRVVAIKIAGGLPKMVDREDLMSYGLFGLIDAIDKFDTTKGAKFETYAVTRIKGSILDEIRSLDWVPRTIRAKARDFERAETELHAQLGRSSEEFELADHLGLTLAELGTLRSQAHASAIVGLEDSWPGSEDGDRAVPHDYAPDPASNPEDLFAAKEIVELLADAIEGMPARSKTILVLYYFQEMTLAEIGEILGVTESRVCQLQSKLLQTLQNSLACIGGALNAA